MVLVALGATATNTSERLTEMKNGYSWLKLHTEARNDAKLESLPDDQFRVWFRLLCFAGDQPERGLMKDYTPRLLAVEVARGNVTLLQDTLASLVELRIIEEVGDGVSFLHWAERQYDNPSDTPAATAERKRRQRERDKAVTNAPEITVSRDVTKSHDTDTDTDTELDKDINSQEYTSTTIVQAGRAPGLSLVQKDQHVDNFTPWADALWDAYPARNGKKLHKREFYAALRTVPSRDYERVTQAVAHYAASSTAIRGYAEDPHRFLRHWTDWLDPETPSPLALNGVSHDPTTRRSAYPSASELKADAYERAAARLLRQPVHAD